MSASLLMIGLTLLAAAGADTAADTITLRDGKMVLGQVVEPSPRGTLLLAVRRDWVEEHVPDLAKRWEAQARPAWKRAAAQRRARLELWKRERAAMPDGADRISPWIDRELARLADPNLGPTRLMLVSLTRGQVQRVVKAPNSARRMLRLGWRSGFKNVEGMSVEALADALESRGFNPKGNAPVAIDDLLPIPVETDAQWLARRAATEATYDTGVRFIQIQQILIPEPVPGQAIDPKSALAALPDLVKLLTGEGPDPVPERLKVVGERGRAGAVVTRQEMSPDLESVTVEMVLWVRGPGGRWAPFGSRSVTVRSRDLNENDGKDLADDPQVQAAFRAFEALGFGQVPDEVKKKGLNAGAATRRALAEARTAFRDDLASLALPVDEIPCNEPRAGKDR